MNMARLDAECVRELSRLRLKPSPRRFVVGLMLRANLTLADRPAPALTSRQSAWLYTLVVEHQDQIRDRGLVRDARSMLSRA